jgi:outer membrane protein
MLVISFPLFNKNQIKRKQLESVYEIKDANLRKDEMKNKLLVEVEKICENAQMIRDNYVSEKETVRLYNEILELRKTQYNLGVITFLDYITAKNNLEATEIELLKSKYNLFFYTQLINFYSGYGIHQDVYQH